MRSIVRLLMEYEHTQNTPAFDFEGVGGDGFSFVFKIGYP
jgi:hypothetical protein